MVKVVAQLSWVTKDGWSTSRGVPIFYLDSNIDDCGAVIREIIMRPYDAVSYTINAGLWEESTGAYRDMRWTHNIPPSSQD